MTTRLDRRDFLRATSGLAAAGTLGVWSQLEAKESQSPNEKLNIAFVGVANKGGDNLNHLLDENVYALCDVDEGFLNAAAGAHRGAKKYRDYRKLIEKEAKHIDAVCVSTADHNHAPATTRALA